MTASASNKVYAVLYPNGKQELFYAWPACQKAVHGKANMVFKGFKDLPSAKNWLEERSQKKVSELAFITEIDIYVDGSFGPRNKYAGWGWVAVKNGEKIAESFGKTPFPAESRNIDGELEAAAQAMEWTQAQGLKSTIVHDYTGIACWAKGEWAAKSKVAKDYLVRVKPLLSNVIFKKVEGHSGDKWNDYVDELAKKGLEYSP